MTLRPENARLVLPTMTYATPYLAARAEGFSDSSEGPRVGPTIPPDNLAWHITSLNRQSGTTRLEDGTEVAKVPFAHLWMVAGEEFIGRVGVRYRLDEHLRRWGGHIGYEVRPSYWGRGFGHRALALGIAHAREVGLRALLLTCDDANAASARIIERAGGVLEDVIAYPLGTGRRARRYWIRLDEAAG
jgi:predicted acetyltransferase